MRKNIPRDHRPERSQKKIDFFYYMIYKLFRTDQEETGKKVCHANIPRIPYKWLEEPQNLNPQ